jgi:uncharacterized protein (DUF362 family)
MKGATMNRRQFCETMLALGGAAAFGPLLEACGRSEPPPAPTLPPTAAAGPTATAATGPTAAPVEQSATAVPTPTPDPTLATVALVATADRAAGLRRVVELLGVNPVRGLPVLLKPNFNSADPTPGSTHPDVLRALLSSLSDMGARSLALADRSGMGDTRRVMRQLGVPDLARTYGCDIVVLDELPDDAWALFQRDGFHWQQGFPVPKLLLDAPCVVQTCNLKTHRYGGHFTLSLKNSVGLVAKHYGGTNYMNELHGTDHQRRMIAEINTAYRPALLVLDGVEAFVKGGPATGDKAATRVMLASTDRVAMDAVGVTVLRLFGTTREVSRGRIFEQEQIARAVELGLGASAADKIRFVTGDADSAAYAARIMELLAQG